MHACKQADKQNHRQTRRACKRFRGSRIDDLDIAHSPSLLEKKKKLNKRSIIVNFHPILTKDHDKLSQILNGQTQLSHFILCQRQQRVPEFLVPSVRAFVALIFHIRESISKRSLIRPQYDAKRRKILRSPIGTVSVSIDHSPLADWWLIDRLSD